MVRLLCPVLPSRCVEVCVPDDRTPTVAEILKALTSAHSELWQWIYANPLRLTVNVVVGDKNIRALDGLNTRVSPGREVWILTGQTGCC